MDPAVETLVATAISPMDAPILCDNCRIYSDIVKNGVIAQVDIIIAAIPENSALEFIFSFIRALLDLNKFFK
jgi:hypothetical protein